MRALICPACGCSLVRLGVAPRPELAFDHPTGRCFFCCAGCLELFLEEPERYLSEIACLDVCPVCLAEKPDSQTVRVEHGDRVLHFCRCPHCMEEFQRQPAYYIERLEGRAKADARLGSCC